MADADCQWHARATVDRIFQWLFPDASGAYLRRIVNFCGVDFSAIAGVLDMVEVAKRAGGPSDRDMGCAASNLGACFR
jgi:hypothetical protein